jgi:hypothetical protein
MIFIPVLTLSKKDFKGENLPFKKIANTINKGYCPRCERYRFALLINATSENTL